MSMDPVLHKIQKGWHGTLTAYLIGFFISLILTSLSFFLVINNLFLPSVTAYSVIALALIQAITQLIFFLHIGQEKKPHFETNALIFAILILFIVVVGSLWVMNDLSFRMMPGMVMELEA